MVNHSVKVFARLKKEKDKVKVDNYTISKASDDLDSITFETRKRRSEYPKKFKFHKIFDQNSKQRDIFEIVAQPVIDRVIDGYNGTIFAYGQTGSGKTYTITGPPKNYNDRGIIPRSLQYIFALNEKVTCKPTVYVSYMEIYNENGYDLLNSKQGKPKKGLEALPKIVLRENRKGEAHIRNLTVQPVNTEQEAMRLLFLGDTNRTIAETPKNEYSSRSHCIFTIYITYRDAVSETIRFSKLHLVDLAGSERVSKSMITGVTLGEAKYINLSLHFLQQVIAALTENRKSHIPYRNSMMTYILRDSLCGNCLTVMLATLAITKDNINETISTCRFAQKVSLLVTEPVVNEIVDTAEEIMFLRNRVGELERKIQILTSFKTDEALTEDTKEKCKWQIKNYLTDNSQTGLNLEPDLPQIHFCFTLMKNAFETNKKSYQEHLQECERNRDQIVMLEKMVSKKEKEINKLKNIIDNIPEKPVKQRLSPRKMKEIEKSSSRISNKKSSASVYFDSDELHMNDLQLLYADFLKRDESAATLNTYRNALERKLAMAKICAETIHQGQKNIMFLKQKLEIYLSGSPRNILINELEEQQNSYKKALAELKDIQSESAHLQAGLEQAGQKTEQKFQTWLRDVRNKRHFKPYNGQEHDDLTIETDNEDKRRSKIRAGWEHVEYVDIVTEPIKTGSETIMHHQCNSEKYIPQADSLEVLSTEKPLNVIEPRITESVCSHVLTSKSSISCFSQDADDTSIECDDTCKCYQECTNSCSMDSVVQTCPSNQNIRPNHECQLNFTEKIQCKKSSNACINTVPYYGPNKCSSIGSPHEPTIDYVIDYRKPIPLNNEICCYSGRTFIRNKCFPSIGSTANFNEEYDDDFYWRENCTSSLSCNHCCSSVDFNQSSPVNSVSSFIPHHMPVIEECALDDEAEHDNNDTAHVNGSEEEPEAHDSLDMIEPSKCDLFFRENDSKEFREFMKTVPLTGEPEVDEEVINFYRTKFP